MVVDMPQTAHSRLNQGVPGPQLLPLAAAALFGVAQLITSISHDAFCSGMHTAFPVAAAVALARAVIALLTGPGHASS